MKYYISIIGESKVRPWKGPYKSIHAAKIAATQRWPSDVYRSMELLVGEAINPHTIYLVAKKLRGKWETI